MALPVWKRAALVPLLLFALWLLTDDDFSESKNHHHMAVFTAMGRHRPCLRVYRSLLELNLLLWGAVVSLWLWNRTVGKKMVKHLLFQPANEPEKELLPSTVFNASYLPVKADEIFACESFDSQPQPKESLSEANALDAHYDSDGEVSEPVPGIFKENDDPPSAEHLAGIAVDSLIVILLSMFLFTFSSAEGGVYVDGMSNISAFRIIALVAAPIFPLLLFVGAVVCSVFPWSKRKDFWQVVYYTPGAPFFHVAFRDGFIGDILTSSVRPMQDIAFTAFYLFSGLQGWWKQSYDLDDADQPLEKNWYLHTWILPMCMVSPLWWRFLQNLRQVYENKKRWPYMGNALKYFIAAEVAMFGVFDPMKKKTFLWISGFVAATLYQIWWDVFMDWELLVVEGGQVRLRNTRIYSVKWMYWAIFGVNCVLRFCWTLSFLPPRYLDSAGVLSETFKGDLLDPMIACAEIMRRTLWGFLRVELEAIKVARKEPSLKGTWSDDTLETEMKDLATEVFEQSWKKDNSPAGALSLKKMSDIQVLIELSIYATIFTGFGMVAAAHRMTY
eukprot:CAMPEP_0117001770 /NCGR_PEP_ID=MMETSP0472-20121206/3665_1 /TAXON_ID=693140 ORGANISM="Tiarina fusus, Strain LIS" /NCGR_SAMPLE_ID=MMETSP0472 /ASSEMBLY_ACC=CAM_ASM_000603 /LENGTH=556 /DNA_ID=CAMNT_0004701901 /DNA_START=53 /DNA_END=1723 /DNA_ORIENTATION=-